MAEQSQSLSLTKLLAQDPGFDIDTKLSQLRRGLTSEVHRVDAEARVSAEFHDQILTVKATLGKSGAR